MLTDQQCEKWVQLSFNNMLRACYQAGQEAEREERIKTCDSNASGDWTRGALACAAAIRARSYVDE